MDVYLTVLAIIMVIAITGSLCYAYVKYKSQIHSELDDLRILLHSEARIDTPFYVYSEPVESGDENSEAEDAEK